MLVIIGGVVVGAVVAGIGWGIDRYKRKQRYDREKNEHQETLKEKRGAVKELRGTKKELEGQVVRNRKVLQGYEENAKKLKQGRDEYRCKVSTLKDKRDDLEEEKNDQQMKSSFADMGF